LVAHSILVAAWHMLKSGEPIKIPAGDYYARRNPFRTTNRLVAQFERLGRTVTLREPLDNHATRFSSGHQRRGLLDAEIVAFAAPASPSWQRLRRRVLPKGPLRLLSARRRRDPFLRQVYATASLPLSSKYKPVSDAIIDSPLVAADELHELASDESRTRAAVALRLRVAVANRSSIVYVGGPTDRGAWWWTCGESSCRMSGCRGLPAVFSLSRRAHAAATGRFEGSARVCCAAV
jgi:hypothetical protein